MAQFLRPDGIITAGLWTGNISGANYHLDIDEVTRDDADYAQGNLNATTLGEVSLSNGFSPQQTAGRTFRYALRRLITNKNCTIIIRLMEGSTTLQGWTHANPTNTFTLFTRDVSGVTITDYTNLSVQMEITVNSGGGQRGQVSWVELEIPDAVATSDTPAYTRGADNLASHIPVFLKGPQEFTSSIHAYLKGQASEKSSVYAYLKLSLDDKSSRPAFTFGALGITGSAPAFIDGWGQVQLPDGNGVLNLWVDQTGTTEVYLAVADPADDTFATIEHAGIGDYFDVDLEDFDTIEEGIVYYEWRAWRITGSEVITMECQLWQGDDLIAIDSRVLSATPTTFHRDLTIAEKNSITSLIDLRLRFIVTGVS